MKKTLFFAIAIAVLSATPGFGEETQTPNAGAQSFYVGKIEVVAVHDNHFDIANDGKTFGIGATPEAVAETLSAAAAPTAFVTVQFSGLLVKDGKRLVLIDSGAGPGMKGGMIDSLAAAGVTPDQITDVLITHSHFDHVGGLVDADGKSVFTHATIRMTDKEWAFMQANRDQAAISAAIAAQVKTFVPGAKLTPHIVAVPVDGHTPGHTAYEIDGGNARLLDVGDTVHSSIVSLAHPEWGFGFDSDRAVGEQSRVALLKRLAQSQELIFAPHFPFPGIGRIAPKGDGFVFKPAKTY